VITPVMVAFCCPSRAEVEQEKQRQKHKLHFSCHRTPNSLWNTCATRDPHPRSGAGECRTARSGCRHCARHHGWPSQRDEASSGKVARVEFSRKRLRTNPTGVALRVARQQRIARRLRIGFGFGARGHEGDGRGTEDCRWRVIGDAAAWIDGALGRSGVKNESAPTLEIREETTAPRPPWDDVAIPDDVADSVSVSMKVGLMYGGNNLPRVVEDAPLR
jgi:hypothetical protein